MRHISYLRYVLRHKWFVFVASIRIGAPLLHAIVHDWSKLLPDEWIPYAFTFYDEHGKGRYLETPAFAMAWNTHQKRNKHHWQYWLLTEDDSGETTALVMPNRHALEMLADWMGAGRAITGTWAVKPWYEAHKTRINLHSETRLLIEERLHALEDMEVIHDQAHL